MAETALITQSAVASLDAQIVQLLTMVEGVATSDAASYNVLLDDLNAHIQESYAVAHGGISAVSGTYLNSGGYVDGNYIMTFTYNNQTYYVPASLSPAGVPQPPPPPPPPPSSGSRKHC